MSLYVWQDTLQYHLLEVLESHNCECQSCPKERNPERRAIIDASPAPFLSRGSAAPKEAYQWWKSLQHTPQDVDYFMKTVDRLFQIFPPSPDFFKPSPDNCRSCAVVGNSGNLLGSHYGPLIDFHKIVIRINKAPTEGYEEDVGTKTTHHVMYPESAVNLANTTHLVFFSFKMRDLEWLLRSFDPANNKGQSGRRGNKDLVMIINPAFMKYVNDMWIHKRGYYPSTGFMVLILSLVVCDEVSVFGFGPGSDGNWHHYYEKGNVVQRGTGPHSRTDEYNIIEDLHKKKTIRLYNGTNKPTNEKSNDKRP
ncbi:CMP-N-acetylneuraminate-beta-galactosamide-alpha-2,3-sialyltransferase 2-like [Halichoeres trimaculatus]|uniref:CMP-N-acetylneuraminate-beta-galactosamide- alpha-2,3-sialyltransferase 2-like n=1 Tax=Halichoeres trimaculatus TaxID=147232 RepID=UPI003D9E4864